jgi:CysZ protein
MIEAAAKALSQMLSPPFRSVLLKSAGLALVLIAVVAVALYRIVVWLETAGANWSETMLGSGAHAGISVAAWSAACSSTTSRSRWNARTTRPIRSALRCR